LKAIALIALGAGTRLAAGSSATAAAADATAKASKHAPLPYIVHHQCHDKLQYLVLGEHLAKLR